MWVPQLFIYDIHVSHQGFYVTRRHRPSTIFSAVNIILQHTCKMELPPPLFGSKKKNEVKLNINMKLKIKHWAVHGEFTFYFYFTLFCLSKFFDWAPPFKNYATNLTRALFVSYSTRSCELLWLTVNCFLSILKE